jgi:hypothetical protein
MTTAAYRFKLAGGPIRSRLRMVPSRAARQGARQAAGTEGYTETLTPILCRETGPALLGRPVWDDRVK